MLPGGVVSRGAHPRGLKRRHHPRRRQLVVVAPKHCGGGGGGGEYFLTHSLPLALRHRHRHHRCEAVPAPLPYRVRSFGVTNRHVSMVVLSSTRSSEHRASIVLQYTSLQWLNGLRVLPLRLLPLNLHVPQKNRL